MHEKLRVLVVDDNPAIHEDFRKILGSATSASKDLSSLEQKLFQENSSTITHFPTYEVNYASQGQEALAYVKKALEEESPYALAFVDIRMPPGWDGIETIQQIWQVDPWIQVVICTAYSDYSWNDIVKILGDTDNLIILKKPFDVVEVRQLASSLTKKWQLSAEVKKNIGNLEEIVQQRTLDLEKSLSLVRATLESTADGILVVDINGKIVDYNKLFSEMWKIPAPILSSRLDDDALAFVLDQLQDPEGFLLKIKYLYKNKEMESIDELRLKDGRYFERYSKPHKVRDKIVGRVWSFRNITERKKMNAEILYQATHDKLTGLINRRLLYDRIKLHVAYAERNKNVVAVLFFDLDRFKLVNDSLGHDAGDFVLKLVAKRVSEVIRESDTLARLGGDEFVSVFIVKKDESEVANVANKILLAIRRPFIFGKHEFFLTASIGISLYPSDAATAEGLIQKADSAMYEVKMNGKNNFAFYEKDMSTRVLFRVTLESDLRKAIENQELLLYYQPLIDMLTGNIVGIEALIRWNHPTFGLLLPDVFLSIAEESGLIVPIGEWVLRTACTQVKAWQNEKLPFLKIAINVSSTQFKYPKFDVMVENILKETGLSSHYLELELTESIIIENPDLMLDILNKVKKIGVGLVIDDFGMGYSSLNYLKKFPFDKLKIDKTFVQDVNTDEADAKIVQTIIAMADDLKLQVVAEGIETESQYSFLSKIKCNQAQGYFLGKPVNAQNFAIFLRNYSGLPKL